MNQPARYSGISTINHWVTTLLVIAMLVLGLAAAEAPSDSIEDYVIGAHISLGFFAFLFIVWRVGFRLYEGFPPTLGDPAPVRWAAWSVHRLMLIVLILQVFTGPLYLFTEGESVDVFGWFSVAIPLESLSAIHEPIETIHVVLGLYVIPLLLLLHVSGAIRHYLRDERRETPADM